MGSIFGSLFEINITGLDSKELFRVLSPHISEIILAATLLIIVMMLLVYRKKVETFHQGDIRPRYLDADLVKRIICYNQGKLAEVQYLAGIKHKELRLNLENFKRSEAGVSVETLRQSHSNLVRFIVSNICLVARENFKLLHEYFEGRHSVSPRICLKTNLTAKNDGDQALEILDIARCGAGSVPSRCFIEENYGFRRIRDTGSYYFEANIPRAAKRNADDGRYVNPRLKAGAAKNYSMPLFVSLYNWVMRRLWKKLPKLKGFERDIRWENCWEGTGGTSDVDPKAYKSTLIVPLTFWNNDKLADEFFLGLRLFEQADLDDHSIQARSILGYLCFDHADTNFFNEGVDVQLGYIAADLLCLYMAVLSNYTRTSTTFDEALNFINQPNG